MEEKVKKRITFDHEESDVCEKTYNVLLSHDQIRSLIEWIPKNYETEPHEEGGVLLAILEDAELVV